jgi:two-component sensor histidine kinase/integral membrane sensor domain MASE1
MLQKFVNASHARQRVGAEQWAGRISLAVGVGVAYFLIAELGLSLLTATERVAVFWPASGIAVGILIAFGRRACAPVATGVIVASAAAALLSDRNVWTALAFGFCNAGEALLVMWLIERWFGTAFNLDSVRRVLGLFAATALAPAIAAVGASGAMQLFSPSTAGFLDIWKVWFASDALGIIAVAPLLIGIVAAVRDPPPWRELLEGTLAVVAVAVANGFALAFLAGPWSLMAPGMFLFPLLLWVSSRCRPVFAAAAAFCIAATIVWTTIHEFGRYGDPTRAISDRVLAAHVAILGTALAVLALAAVFAERRRHEMALGELDARLRSSLDAANVVAWDVDLIRDSVHSAGPVRRMLHRPKGPVPRGFAEMLETIHPEDRDRVMAQFWAAARTETTFRVEFRLNSDDLRWLTAVGSIERDAHGVPMRMRGITHDITDLRKAERSLDDRNMQLSLAGKAALVGSFTLDFETEEIQFSEGYAAIHDLPEGMAHTTRSIWKAGLHPEDFQRVDDLRERVLCDQKREHDIEYRIVRSTGEVRWIEARCFISYGCDGRPRRAVGVDIDITLRKRAEQQQRMLVAELNHRVKNVLATVAAVASRTQSASLSAADFAAKLAGRIQSMAATHELISHREWNGISVRELVQRELAPYMAKNNADLDGPDLTLSPDAAQAVSMVLHELATNAAKYGALSTLQGRVSVRWEWRSNGHVPASLKLEWHEQGGPVVTVPAHAGYGTSVIRDLIPYELGGAVELKFAPDGLRCIVVIPDEQARHRDDVAHTSTGLAAVR